jgi:hypothetical protein
VRDIRTWNAVNEIARTGECRLELLTEEDGALLASMEFGPGEPFRLGPCDPAFVCGLDGLDERLPAPLFMARDQIAGLCALTTSQRADQWQLLRQIGPAERPLRVSLCERLSTASGEPLDENFLVFFRRNPFRAPSIQQTGTMSQDELNRLWEAGTERMEIRAFFETDALDLSHRLRAWARSPSTEEFPFNFAASGPDSPIVRSSLTIRFLPIVDRIWHREWPVVIELRPISRQESYALEAMYWRSVGDERRAELAEEIKARLENEADG